MNIYATNRSIPTLNNMELNEKNLSRAQKDAYDYTERLEKATTSEHKKSLAIHTVNECVRLK